MRTTSLFPVLKIVGLATVGALALAGCAAGVSSAEAPVTTGEPVAGGTFTFATGDAEPPCLDPAAPGNVPQALLGTQVIESLFFQDETGEIKPWLVEAWDVSADGLTYTFTTREDVVFSDGTPFDAEAIKANVEWMKDPTTGSSTGALALKKVDTVTVTDPRTAVLHLNTPDAALLESFAHIWLPIQSPVALARGVDANCLEPVGTGPFKVVEWSKQSQIVLERNELYASAPPDAEHDGQAYVERVVWRFLPDDNARLAALQTGEVDAIDRVPPEAVQAIENDASLELLIRSRPGIPEILYLNASKAPFDDVRVREAFVRSVDLDAGLQSVFLGSIERSHSLLSTVTKFGVELPEYFTGDPERAHDLLDEAGWTERDADGYRTKDGDRLVVDFLINGAQTTAAQKALFEQIQATAKDVGFEVLLRPVDFAMRYTETVANRYDLTTAYYTKNSADVLRIVFHSSSIEPIGGYRANVPQVDLPELDEQLELAGETQDPAIRAEAYAAAQEIVASGFYALPTFDQQTRLAYRSDVHGLRLIPAVSMPTFHDVWVDR